MSTKPYCVSMQPCGSFNLSVPCHRACRLEAGSVIIDDFIGMDYNDISTVATGEEADIA